MLADVSISNLFRLQILVLRNVVFSVLNIDHHPIKAFSPGFIPYDTPIEVLMAQMPLSAETIIAVITLIVTGPPSILLAWSYFRRGSPLMAAAAGITSEYAMSGWAPVLIQRQHKYEPEQLLFHIDVSESHTIVVRKSRIHARAGSLQLQACK